MAKNIDKVIDRAHRQLKPSSDKKARNRVELLRLYKRFLKIEEYRIRMLHMAGGGGLDIAHRRAELLDVVLHNLFAEALEDGNQKADHGSGKDGVRPEITLVATGGYGRGLLNPGSDIDLLFLHPDPSQSINKHAAEVIEQILYMLWDVGFVVGHATRSIKETARQANVDNQTKCALIEARFITGNRALYNEFQKRFEKECIQGKEDAFLAARAADLKTRHAKYSNTIHLQEPNVKYGCGGLRDYQNLLWTSFVKRGARDIKDLVDGKLLSLSAYRELEKAYEFLMRVRNDLHYEERRASDTLTLRLQGVVATHLGYPQRTILRRCEEFMRDYYMHSRNMFYHTTSVMQSFELEEQDRKDSTGIIPFLARRKRKVEYFDGFCSKNNFIYPENAQVFEEDPQRMMRAFQHAQQRHLRFSPRIRKLYKAHYSLINRTFRYSKASRETFEAILSRKGDVGRALRQMHRVQFLGRYLPEFGALDCLVQHEFFHRYTADEHTLLCIDKLDELSDSQNPKQGLYQELFHKLEDPYIFYLALILHDTGRAKNYRFHADASVNLANQVCRRLRISGERRRRLLFLIDHHLTLWKTATTKNLDDPNTIAEFARIIRDKLYLDALLLFTFVDSNSTNETGWSSWKETLILQLYKFTGAFFENQEAFTTQLQSSVTGLKAAVARKLGPGLEQEIEAHFQQMPERYFLFRTTETVVEHIRRFHQFFESLQKSPEGSLTPVLHWKAHPDKGYSELQVYSWDRSLLLARVAGALAARNINILSADIFTRRDNLVLDIFRVCNTNFEPVTSKTDIQAVNEIIKKAFAADTADFREVIGKSKQKSDFDEAIEETFPKRVYLSNEQSPEYTFLEIQTLDRIGLLYDLFSAIGDLGIETVASRINTEKGAAIDSFYLSDLMGRKLTDPLLLAELKSRIESVLGIKGIRRHASPAPGDPDAR